MRSLVALTVAALLIATAYVASPFYAAWTLRQAVVTADTATIERKVAWSSVRKSLRTSLANYAELVPLVETATKRVRPTMWQRIKSAFGYSMLDRFIDTYISAEGLPKLYQLRERARDVRDTTANTLPAPPMRAGIATSPRATKADASNWTTTAADFLRRVQRAKFLGLTEVELVIRDTHRPDRHFVSVFALKGFEWTLTSLRVLKVRTHQGIMAASDGQARSAGRNSPEPEPGKRLITTTPRRLHQL